MASANQEAYFVGRSELLNWINGTLGLRLNKVEETWNGAVACQLLDALSPGSVALRRVDFNARSEYDAIANYKVLQDALNRLGIDKHVEVAKLLKGRPLDNTEFMQWFKAYWDSQTGGQGVEGYDGSARRALCKTGDVKQAASNMTPTNAARNTTVAAGGRRASLDAPNTGAAPPGALRPTAGQAAGVSAAAMAAAQPPAKRAPGTAACAASIERLQRELGDLQLQASSAIQARDFYYSKLRTIELFCGIPAAAADPLMHYVEGILFAATEEAGSAVLAAARAELDKPPIAAASAASMGAIEAGPTPHTARADVLAGCTSTAGDAMLPAADQ